MCYSKLLPSHYPGSPDLVGLHSETTVFVIEQVSLLSEDAWKKSHDCPAQESTICSRVAAVEEGIVFL